MEENSCKREWKKIVQLHTWICVSLTVDRNLNIVLIRFSAVTEKKSETHYLHKELILSCCKSIIRPNILIS